MQRVFSLGHQHSRAYCFYISSMELVILITKDEKTDSVLIHPFWYIMFTFNTQINDLCANLKKNDIEL